MQADLENISQEIVMLIINSGNRRPIEMLAAIDENNVSTILNSLAAPAVYDYPGITLVGAKFK